MYQTVKIPLFAVNLGILTWALSYFRIQPQVAIWGTAVFNTSNSAFVAGPLLKKLAQMLQQHPLYQSISSRKEEQRTAPSEIEIDCSSNRLPDIFCFPDGLSDCLDLAGPVSFGVNGRA